MPFTLLGPVTLDRPALGLWAENNGVSQPDVGHPGDTMMFTGKAVTISGLNVTITYDLTSTTQAAGSLYLTTSVKVYARGDRQFLTNQPAISLVVGINQQVTFAVSNNYGTSQMRFQVQLSAGSLHPSWDMVAATYYYTAPSGMIFGAWSLEGSSDFVVRHAVWPQAGGQPVAFPVTRSFPYGGVDGVSWYGGKSVALSLGRVVVVEYLVRSNVGSASLAAADGAAVTSAGLTDWDWVWTGTGPPAGLPSGFAGRSDIALEPFRIDDATFGVMGLVFAITGTAVRQVPVWRTYSFATLAPLTGFLFGPEINYTSVAPSSIVSAWVDGARLHYLVASGFSLPRAAAMDLSTGANGTTFVFAASSGRAQAAIAPHNSVLRLADFTTTEWNVDSGTVLTNVQRVDVEVSTQRPASISNGVLSRSAFVFLGWASGLYLVEDGVLQDGKLAITAPGNQTQNVAWSPDDVIHVWDVYDSLHTLVKYDLPSTALAAAIEDTRVRWSSTSS